VPYDIHDAEGRLLHPAGVQMNPLDHIAFERTLLFFDGDDPTQRDWARDYLADMEQADRNIPLLTNGPIIELMQQWQVRLYFDQGGRYVERLGIQVLPSVAYREGRLLRIDTVALEAP
jgi:conjugal transfer pilus assembly protein TraW